LRGGTNIIGRQHTTVVFGLVGIMDVLGDTDIDDGEQILVTNYKIVSRYAGVLYFLYVFILVRFEEPI
jgi:hypothetical protein